MKDMQRIIVQSPTDFVVASVSVLMFACEAARLQQGLDLRLFGRLPRPRRDSRAMRSFELQRVF